MKKSKSRNAPMIQIGGGKLSADTLRVLRVLDARLEQALTLGREMTAVELAKRIGELGGVHNVSINNSTFAG